MTRIAVAIGWNRSSSVLASANKLPAGMQPVRPAAPRSQVDGGTNTLTTKSPVLAFLVASILVMLVGRPQAISADPDALGDRDRDELLGCARNTWRSVAEMGDASELPADGLQHQVDGTWKPSRKTSPTDISGKHLHRCDVT